MNAQTSFNQYLASWKFAVAGRAYEKWPEEIITSSHDEYRTMATALHTAKGAAILAGYPCGQNGSQSTNRMSMWISSGNHKIKIAWQPAQKTKRPQAVTATSREAYHTNDFTTQRGQIAAIIFDATRNGKSITRKEIEVYHRLGCNVVAGRVKELLEMSEKRPFIFGAYRYRLKVTGTRLSSCEGASNVPNEELMWVEDTDEKRAEVRAVQGEMF